MPIILRFLGYRFLFYSNENGEPPHIHVKKGGAHAKFWLEPVILAGNDGFKEHQITKLKKIIEKYEASFVKAWNKFFNL